MIVVLHDGHDKLDKLLINTMRAQENAVILCEVYWYGSQPRHSSDVSPFASYD